MRTGGGSVLMDKRRGSIALTPSQGKNHNFPSADLATGGQYIAGSARGATPSELSKTVIGILRVGSLTDAFNSAEATRISPQTVDSQTDWSSSSMLQCTASQGNPLPLFTVTTRPSSTWLSPLSMATQSAPCASSRRWLTRPAPSPSAAVYDARTSRSLTYATRP